MRLVDLKLFSVEGPAKLRDLEGRIAVSVRLRVWPQGLTVWIEHLTLSDELEYFPTHIIHDGAHIWWSVFRFSFSIIKITTYLPMLYDLFIQV